jgi:hypothetical protein
VCSNRIGKLKATNQFAIQLTKIPMAIAVSRAEKYLGYDKHAMQPGQQRNHHAFVAYTEISSIESNAG